MQVKKFEAETLQEALETIKREMGPEAIVLQTRHHKRRFGLLSKPSVEVTVAVSTRSAEKKRLVEQTVPAQTKAEIEKLPARVQAEAYDKFFDREVEKRAGKVKDQVSVGGKQITSRRYIDIPDDDSTRPVARAIEARPQQIQERQELKLEIDRLRKMILEMKSVQDAASDRQAGKLEFSQAALQAGFDQLVVSGVDRRLAYSIVKQVEFAGQGATPAALADEVLKAIPVGTILEGLSPKAEGSTALPHVVVFVGPAGAGKSSLLGKLASRAMRDRKLRVALGSLGSPQVAQGSVIESIARLFQIPHREFKSASDLNSGLRDLLAFDLVCIDTPSLSAKDQEGIKRLQAELALIQNVRTYVVFSATTRDQELSHASKQFLALRPLGIAFTHLDEALSHGQILNAAERTRLPLVAFGTGQKVPDDYEPATPERLAALLLDLK